MFINAKIKHGLLFVKINARVKKTIKRKTVLNILINVILMSNILHWNKRIGNAFGDKWQGQYDTYLDSVETEMMEWYHRLYRWYKPVS